MKITDLNNWREGITSQYAENDANALFLQIHRDFAKRTNSSIEHDGKHVENIIY